jgi:hypothetical protein
MAEAGKPFRAFGWAFLIVFAMIILARSSRPDRISGIYAVMFAAGATALEQWGRRLGSAWVRKAIGTIFIGLQVGVSAVLLPVVLPVLPPETTAGLATRLGLAQEMEKGKRTALPQILADRLGWNELAHDVAAVYERLPSEERSKVAIVTSNYGEASALRFLGKPLGLPPAVSGHNQYYLWGPPAETPEVVITVGLPRKVLDGSFNSVEPMGVFSCGYCMENGAPIFLAKGLRRPVRELWPLLKMYE